MKHLVALHSILPAARNWEERVNEQGGWRRSFSEPGLFMLTNFPTAKGVPMLLEVPPGTPEALTPQSPPGALATQPSFL